MSLELTGVWVNEAREIVWTGMILDKKPPDDDHWWYRQAEEIKSHGWVFFRQPGALLPLLDPQGRILSYEANPATENVQHQPLGVYRGHPIHLGFDFGLTPACIIEQIAPNGQLRILRELICQRGGIKQFVTDAVTPMLNTLFPSLPVISTGDPAGAQASQADELTCLRQLQLLGIPTQPAPTNAFLARRH